MFDFYLYSRLGLKIGYFQDFWVLGVFCCFFCSPEHITNCVSSYVMMIRFALLSYELSLKNFCIFWGGVRCILTGKLKNILLII